MRKWVICGIILLALALNYGAIAQVDLSGANGQAILNRIATSAPITNISTNASLWSWGNIPMGYTLNQTGQLVPTQNVLHNDFGGWVPSI